MSEEDKSAPPQGYRKDGRPYKDGNTREDGTYGVGKNKPPAQGKFAVGDGRRRGRRPKGVRNADTDFQEEYNRKVTIAEGATKRRVSKGRASMIRLLDNGYNKGQTNAIIEIDRRHQRIVEKAEASRARSTASDAQLLKDYIAELLGQQSAGPHILGDPEPGQASIDRAETAEDSSPNGSETQDDD